MADTECQPAQHSGKTDNELFDMISYQFAKIRTYSLKRKPLKEFFLSRPLPTETSINKLTQAKESKSAQIKRRSKLAGREFCRAESRTR
jgi:hypothetical protein